MMGAFRHGFIKRAYEQGIPYSVAVKLAYSNQDVNDFNMYLKGLSRIGPLAGIGLSLAAGHIASSAMTAKKPDDRINERQSKEWVNKYLGTKNVTFLKEPESANASYSKLNLPGDKKPHHLITYDPKLNKSVMAHEIGHGMTKIPRMGMLQLLAPAALATGALNTGVDLAMERNPMDHPLAGPALAGGTLGMIPILANEWGASHNARKILKDNNIKPVGLNRAWGTYALPFGVAGMMGASGYGLAKHFLNK